ncbi:MULTISPECIES: Mu transposase C-terminal domain-containing protein [Mesorhizobium]|jgi:putative transposase|uniref:Putative transposase n=1 Tax=Mesorhizobium australicum TaxID=536018 RepID=A0A1X7MP64_9HYPH|nr:MULTISPECIES: Mu transposase C-terminal domain-containing protein [Mesorhizobium]KQZ21664.1 transposase [Mesorhizobium sp. Root552]SMH26414.1 putative transposase [Mesorhizobium australicum]
MSDDTESYEEMARWNEACRREEAIRGLLERYPKSLNGQAVADLAWELDLSRATLYRMIKLFRAGGTVSSLMDRKRGRRQGHRALDKDREAVVRRTIEGFYLKPERPSFARLVREVQIDCTTAGLAPPNWRTIKSRVEEIDLQVRGRKRGESEVVKATTATPGSFSASRPLELVQIDHTKVDVFVVDEDTRQPLGRPWLTLALDIFSRMVVGFYLTMGAPSRLSTSLCILHSVFDKTAWLQEREIHEAWPVAGLPGTIHVDNGSDFRSRAFERACRDNGIKLDWRPPGTPHFGGHVERLIGTQMGAVHLLPGSTSSSIEERREYDAKCHAALTLRELERYIALEIVGQYHHAIHGALRRPPIAVWRQHENELVLRLPKDRMQFWISFLPETERTLRPTGIHLFHIRYWSPALSADLGRTKARLIVKYDPRDLSRVFVRRPSGNFVEARYADVTLAPITLWEAQAARRKLNAEGKREIDMHVLVRTALAQRELIQEAKLKTQGRQRLPKPNVDDDELGSLRGVDSSKPVASVEDLD